MDPQQKTFSDPAERPQANSPFLYPQENLRNIALDAIKTGDPDFVISVVKEECDSQNLKKISMIFAWIISDKNPLVNFWCIGIAFGISFTEGKSITEIAKRFGVTKQAISKRVRKVAEIYGCRSRSMKSDSAIESYRHDKLTNHYRYQEIYEQLENNSNDDR